MNDFSGFGLSPELVAKLTELGYEAPTPIQGQAIPAMLSGIDVLGQAATGTGKTAAFALPMLNRVLGRTGRDRKVSGLVLVPTRELAMQVANAMTKYGAAAGARVLAIYGGQDYRIQARGLKSGIDIVVATPGRALDHLRNKTLDLSATDLVVLDEADEMLDMGFLEDIEAILAETAEERQTALFSATMAPRVAAVAKRHLHEPVRIRIAAEKPSADKAPAVRHAMYVVPRAKKSAALATLLEFENPRSALVFCRTRDDVDELTNVLGEKGYRIEALHGGLSQTQRDRVMKRLRNDEIQIVIATDVAARGLDVDHLSHVFNFDMPSSSETYVHRTGRVGRAGRSGVAITLALPKDRNYLRDIERVVGQKVFLENLPSPAAIRGRKLDATRAAIKESIATDDLADYASVFDELAKEFSAIEIAKAAVRLLHIERHGELAPAAPMPEAIVETIDLAQLPMMPITISAGRNLGLRPGDLVGAITGEAGIEGRAIGAIRIKDRSSLVEIRQDVVDRVMAAMSTAKVRGQRLTVSAARR